MKLSTRLLLMGAGIPGALLVASYLGVAALLDIVLHRAVDEGLLTQAAVESVSLFDGPGGHPHLHLSTSPLADRVRGFAAMGAVYDEDGRRIAAYPEGVAAPQGLRPQPTEGPPALSSRTEPEPRRELTVTLADPDGHRYVLWLGVSLEPHARTMDAYLRIGGICLFAALMLLTSVAVYGARRLSGRVRRLATHMQHLREGDFDAVVPGDPAADEIARLRDSIAETTERLRASAESRDRFIADAAHELRTPLAALRTGIDVTLRRDREAAELRDALSAARREAQRLEALATSLLDLAAIRRIAFDRRQTDLRALVDEAVEAARGLAEARDVVVEVEPGEPATACVGAVQVRQALDNLLANAIAHSPEGRTVTVALRGAPGHWELRVRDEGPGVELAQREQIFEPFHRLEHQRPGGGLGLAIVREVARRHGGEAWVDAAPGQGAVFHLRLPRADPDGQA